MQTKNKIVSYRTCLYTNKQYEKSQLVRLIKQNGKLVIDVNKDKPGRGYWLKLSLEMLEDRKLPIILSKRAKCKVDNSLIEELKDYETKWINKETK